MKPKWIIRFIVNVDILGSDIEHEDDACLGDSPIRERTLSGNIALVLIFFFFFFASNFD